MLSMLNDLGQAIASGQGHEAVNLTLARMREYATKHFKTEEEAMTSSRYPGRASHIAEHDSFIEKVLDIEEAVNQGDQVAAGDLWTYLRNWLSEHIQGEDKVLGEHLCASGMS